MSTNELKVIRTDARRICRALPRNGISYTALRLVLVYASSPLVWVFQQIVRRTGINSIDTRRNAEGKEPENMAEGLLTEIWILLWLAISYVFVLRQLAQANPLDFLPFREAIPEFWVVIVLAMIALMLLAEDLHFLFKHFVDQVPKPRSVGRALVLAGANFLEAGVIFACLLLANIRLQSGRLPSDWDGAGPALKASFGALLSLGFDLPVEGGTWIPNAVLSLAAFAVGLLIIAVVLAQLVGGYQEAVAKKDRGVQS